MRSLAIIRIIVLIPMLTGCATAGKSTLLGTSIGMGFGTSVALLAVPMVTTF